MSPLASRARHALPLAILLAIVLAVLASPLPATARPAPPRKVNVLVVSIDSLRRDTVGAYGARLPHAPDASPSPVLDGLAATGVRFTDAYASSPWTLPSHVSLFTGQAPMVHEVETDLQTLGPAHPTLAELLRARGWATAGVFSGPYLEPHWGLGRGFDRYRAMYGREVAEASAALGELDAAIAAADRRGEAARASELRWTRRTAYERVRALSHGDVSSERVTQAALEDLDRLAAGDAPWLLFVHYFDVHYDYVPPAPWDTRFDPGYAGTLDGRGFLGNPRIAEPDPAGLDTVHRRVSARDLEHVQALYAGEVAWVDTHVGRLLERLAARGAADHTLVVVLSDHGDEFFEHGGIGHRRTVHEEVLRIPLLMRLPGVLPAKTVGGAVSLADVAPTILEVAGVPPPPELSGRSMLPLVRGGEDPASRTLVSRLVRIYDGSTTLDGKAIPVRLATVQEAFRRGPIKILRRRQWPLFPATLSLAERATLEPLADEQFRQEEMVWVDLERHPTEGPGAWQRDFAEPRAAAALAAFQERYALLRARRRAATAPAPSPQLREALEGLGYVQPSDEQARAPRDGFQLPPPGDRRVPAPR